MSIVTLVSGGLDSTLMATLVRDEGIEQFPLFIDYGQLNRDREYEACTRNFTLHQLPTPMVVNVQGFGALLSSGLTDSKKRVFEDAFLPSRNLMFLTLGAAYAYQRNARAVAIGLLDDSYSIFPDQTRTFVDEAQLLISKSLGCSIRIVTPLISFSKSDVVRCAKELRIESTWSCHSGGSRPCGKCVACKEYHGLEE
jgi:7-cyano-7-deazaguanine synthase